MNDPKYHPIIFSAPMVRAILERRKTQTRRVVKPQPQCSGAGWHADLYNGGPEWAFWNGSMMSEPRTWKCPFGVPGDRLWVRETFSVESNFSTGSDHEPPHDDGRPILWQEYEEGVMWWQQCHYRATDPAPDLCCESERCAVCPEEGYGPHWRPSIYMPRWACRIVLENTRSGLDKLSNISLDDAVAEGFDSREEFFTYWDILNAKRGYGVDVDPYVWMDEFKRIVP